MSSDVTEPGAVATALNSHVTQAENFTVLLTTLTEDNPDTDLDSQRHPFRC